MRLQTSLLVAALLVASQAQLYVTYENYFDNNPFNNYPVLQHLRRDLEVRAPIAHPAARVSYENFYDANPYNDFPIIVE